MSGASHGLDKHDFIGCRIGTGGKQGKEIKMLYTPAHIRQDSGKPVSARLVIPILVNLYRRENPNSYRLIAWGALADMFAKSLSQGKEMTFICDGSSYWGNVFYVDGTQAFQKDGKTPLQTRQSSFIIREFSWGGDSNNTIIEETTAGMKSGEGLRPAQWDIQGSPDNLVWKQMLEMQTFYQGGERFGYAQVVAPRYAAQILLGDQSKILRTNAVPPAAPGYVAPPPVGYVAPGPVGAQGVPLVNQVQNAFPVNPTGTTLPPGPVQPAGPVGYVPPAGALPVYTAPA